MERQPAKPRRRTSRADTDVLGVTSDEVDVLCLPVFAASFRAISSGAPSDLPDHRLTAIGEAERHVTGAGSDLEYAVARVDVSCFNQASDSPGSLTDAVAAYASACFVNARRTVCL